MTDPTTGRDYPFTEDEVTGPVVTSVNGETGDVVLDAAPTLRCTLEVPVAAATTRTVVETSPFTGQVNDDVSDYLGFKKSLAMVATPTDSTPVAMGIRVLAGVVTDLTAEQITEMGAVSGLNVDGSGVYVTRFDTPGSVRVYAAPGGLAENMTVTFGGLANESGDHGATVTDGTLTLEAGTYLLVAQFSLDVFWG